MLLLGHEQVVSCLSPRKQEPQCNCCMSLRVQSLVLLPACPQHTM